MDKVTFIINAMTICILDIYRILPTIYYLNAGMCYLKYSQKYISSIKLSILLIKIS